MKWETFLLLITGLVGYGLYRSTQKATLGELGLNLFDPAHVVLKPKKYKRRGAATATSFDEQLQAELTENTTVNGLGEYPLHY
jgi:hypothetical protein